MEKENIEQLIKQLDKEIHTSMVSEEKEEALFRLQEIAKEYSGEDKVISSLEISAMMKTRPVQKKIMTGLGGLDKILDGFREKQLIVLSGITKHGKTSLAVDLSCRLKELNPLWLPFEGSAEEIIEKFHDRNEEPPLFFTPQRMTKNHLDWIEQKIIEAKAKYNSGLVFIDHLGYIKNKGDNRLENLNQEIGDTMRTLKRLAVRWNMVIILLAHLKKIPLDRNPDLEDLRDSSSIPQEADTVMILWRETKREKGEVIITNHANLSVQANRRTGKTGNIKLIYDNGKFLELDKNYSKEVETIKAEDIDSNW